MAEARMKDEWSRTSSLMALIANVNRDPKKTRAFKPRDFDPFARSGEPVKADVGVLKDVFIEGRIPNQCKKAPS
jgi:hypothetical protein